MISKGNTKLGKGIWVWNIPAVATCPGATDLCRDVCYALRGRFRSQATKQKHEDNWQKLSILPEFPGWMIASLHLMGVRVLRVHVAGDFYSVAYARKWVRIVKTCPDVIFYAYSRSYRIPAIRKELLKLASLANFHLWWSVDRQTGIAICEPPIKGMAYLSTGDDDLPDYPVTLVFRDNDDTPMVFDQNGNWVCPYEQGVRRKVKITCTTCKYCFTDRQRFRGHETKTKRIALPLVNQ